MANRIVAIGKEDGVSTPVSTRDAATYIQEAYGVREDVVSRSNVTDTATLAEWGDRELALRQQGRQILGIRTKGNLQPSLGSYDVGDRVRVRISTGIESIDGLYRISAIRVRISNQDEEDIELEFGESEDVGTTIDELEERVENLETAA